MRNWMMVMMSAGAIAGACCRPAEATNQFWVNLAGGNASVARNWNPPMAPASNSWLWFHEPGQYTVTFDSLTSTTARHEYLHGDVTQRFLAPHAITSKLYVSGDAQVRLAEGDLSSRVLEVMGNGTYTVEGSSSRLTLTPAWGYIVMTPFIATHHSRLHIIDGGYVSALGMQVGMAGAGTIRVSGRDETTSVPATLEVIGTEPSSLSRALFVIEDGGVARFNGPLTVNASAGRQAVVVIDGSSGRESRLESTSAIRVGGADLYNPGGEASITVDANGQLHVSGAVIVGGNALGGSALVRAVPGAAITTGSIECGIGGIVALAGSTFECADAAAFTAGSSLRAELTADNLDAFSPLVVGSTATLAGTLAIDLAAAGGAAAGQKITLLEADSITGEFDAVAYHGPPCLDVVIGYTGTTVTATFVQATCPGDVWPEFSGDDQVDIDDLLAVINGWGPCALPTGCAADADCEGTIGPDDIAAVLASWGACP